VLLVGAGTMVAGFRKMVAMDMGFDRSHVLTFEVSLPKDKYRDQDRIRGYYDQVLHRIQSLPGVESAACLSSLPSGWAWNWTAFEIEGKPASTAAETPSAIQQVVSPDFSLPYACRYGRAVISEQDGKDALEVAVLSEDMAKRNWREKVDWQTHSYGQPLPWHHGGPLSESLAMFHRALSTTIRPDHVRADHATSGFEFGFCCACFGDHWLWRVR
jgi:hypothetical protein